MSAKNYGHTYEVHFRFSATHKQLAKILHRTGLEIDYIQTERGERHMLPSGAILKIRSVNQYYVHFAVYGFSEKIEDMIYRDSVVKLPRDLIEEITFIINSGLFIEEEFMDE